MAPICAGKVLRAERFNLSTSARSVWVWALFVGAVLLCGIALVQVERVGLHETPAGANQTLPELLALPPEPLGQVSIARMNLLCTEGLTVTNEPDVEGCMATLGKWAERVRSETERHFYRFKQNPAEFENSEGFFRMLMLVVVLAEDFGVRYDPQKRVDPTSARMDDGFFANPRDVFLHGLLGPERRGTCSSLPVLYVAIGRELGYPLKLVTTKGHLFVRWEDGPSPQPSPGRTGRGSQLQRDEWRAASDGRRSPDPIGRGRAMETSGERFNGPTFERFNALRFEHFNVEATSHGLNRFSDDYYRHWPFEITSAEEASEGYLKSLTPPEELAVFLSIRGMCLREAGRLKEAAEGFGAAAKLSPGCRSYRVMEAESRQRVGERNL